MHRTAADLMAPSMLRFGAAAAGMLLAVLSRGDAILLALLLALVAWRPVPAVAIGTALAATSWRWGSTSLDAWSGAQAVLGPAGWVGPTAAAASSWLAALAVLLAASRPFEVGGMGASDRRVGAPNLVGAAPTAEVGGMGASDGRVGAPNLVGALVALAAGATVTAVVVGPAPGGAITARVAATVVASFAALALSTLWAKTPRAGVRLDIGGAIAGLAALALAAVDAPPLKGTIDTGALAEGVVLALAAGVLVAVGVAAMGARRA